MPPADSQSRRTTNRLVFKMPRPARFATYEVVLVDLSLKGAGIQHPNQIPPGTKSTLRFRLEREYHELTCEIKRSKLQLVRQGANTLQIYRSGLQFTGLEGQIETIKEALRKRVQRAIARQQADAFSNAEAMNGIDESSGAIPLAALASWMETRPYVRCMLERNGRWKSEKVDSPEQPANGFTVSSDEGDKEIDLLRRAFEKANEEQRRLIRVFAQITLATPSDEPRGRYEP
ncbi:MAG: PilZ domain-containing protein [Thermoanaerobaculia bacterium]